MSSDIFSEALIQLRSNAVASAPPLRPRRMTRVEGVNLISTGEHEHTRTHTGGSEGQTRLARQKKQFPREMLDALNCATSPLVSPFAPLCFVRTRV